jgi:hypothetical protein
MLAHGELFPPARTTCSARDIWGHDDPFALLPSLDIRSYLGDGSDYLMPQHCSLRNEGMPSLIGLKIGGTDPAHGYMDDDLAKPRARRWPFLHDQVLWSVISPHFHRKASGWDA